MSMTIEQIRADLAKRTTTYGCPKGVRWGCSDCPYLREVLLGDPDSHNFCSFVMLRKQIGRWASMRVDREALLAMRIYWQEHEL